MPAYPPKTLKMPVFERGSSSTEQLSDMTKSAETPHHKLEMACSTEGLQARFGGPRFSPEGEAAGQVVCCSLDQRRSYRKYGGDCISQGRGVLKTFAQASAKCSELGLRLCDSSRQLDTSCGDGCGLGGSLVWTSERMDGGSLDFGRLTDHVSNAHNSFLEALQDWRIDSLMLLVIVLSCVLFYVFCCMKDRSRELMHDGHLLHGPSWVQFAEMKARGRPPGYTGDSD
jgi:hypothetical protein